MGLGDRFKKLFGSSKSESESKSDEITPVETDVSPSAGKTIETVKEDDNATKGSFSYLEALVRSGDDVIVLDSDIVRGDDESAEYYGGIELDTDGIVIDGAGHSIDGGRDGRIFHCTARNVTLKNITLKNGSHLKGGAIYNEGELAISRSTLAENTAELIVRNYGEGGAICNEGKLTVTDCDFSKNVACIGGSISNRKGELEIIRSSFADCTIIKTPSDEGGSALFNREGHTSIIDSSFSGHFIHNDVFGHNGAISNYKGKLNVSGCEFSNVKSQERIAAVFNSYGDAVIEDSRFCDSSLPGGMVFSQGYSDNGRCTISNCRFLNNTTSEDIIHNRNFLTVAGCLFKGNECENVLDNSGTALVLKGKFIENNVTKSVVFNHVKYCTLEECDFKGNLVSIADSRNIINESHLTLKNVRIAEDGRTILNGDYIFLKNSPDDFKSRIEGGEVESDAIPDGDISGFESLDVKIHDSDEKVIVLSEDVTLQPNETDYYEGGIELDIDGLTIDGNGRTIDGGGKSRIFIITAKDITLKNIIFTNGRCFTNSLRTIRNDAGNNNGGAIRVNSNGDNLTIDNCIFQSNQSSENGGAIDNFRADELKISDCRFTQNSAGVFGGAVNNHKGGLIVSDSEFSANDGMYGGAINDYGGEMKVSGSDFHENSAKFGGAAYLRYSNVAMRDSSLRENTASRENTHTIASVKSDLCIDKSCSIDWEVLYSSSDPYLYEFV